METLRWERKTWEPALLHFTAQGTLSSKRSHLDVFLGGPLLPTIAILAKGTACLAFFSLNLSESILLYQGPQWALPMLPSHRLTLFSIAVNYCGEG